MADLTYFDYAAATPLDERVLAAMHPYLTRQFFNPSATYRAAEDVHDALESARREVAHWLGSRPNEVVFTAGGSEANNLAIHGVMRRFPEANIVVSAVEHDSVLEPAGQYDRHVVAVEPDGRISLDALRAAIDDQTVLVSIMYANNEVGTIQPLKEIGQIVAEIREQRRQAGNDTPLYLHSDACQAGNYLDLHVTRLGVDLLSLNGGKVYGPKQSGALFVKAGVQLQPLISGGGQEYGLRSGTENVAGAIGFAMALSIAQELRHEEAARLQALQHHFIHLLERELPAAVVNGSLKHRLPNNLHITLPGADNERLIMELDEQGILAAAGSACSASDEEPSHVLKAMGLDEATAQASLRFTMGRGTTQAQVEQLVAALKSLA